MGFLFSSKKKNQKGKFISQAAEHKQEAVFDMKNRRFGFL